MKGFARVPKKETIKMSFKSIIVNAHYFTSQLATSFQNEVARKSINPNLIPITALRLVIGSTRDHAIRALTRSPFGF